MAWHLGIKFDTLPLALNHSKLVIQSLSSYQITGINRSISAAP